MFGALCAKEKEMIYTSLEGDGWELESAIERYREYPEKFEIPSKEELKYIQVGDMVKLLFLFWEYDKPQKNIVSCERMWVTIKSINGENISGQLESEPRTSEILKPLDSISFTREYICAVYIRKSDPKHPEYGNENT